MKRLLICLFVGVLLSPSVLGQPWTVEEVKQQLPRIYKVFKLPLGNNQFHLTTTFDTLSPSHPLHLLAKKQAMYLSYLTTRYSHIDYANIFMPGVSFEDADEALRKAIAKDTLLNRCFLETATYYLQAQGVAVKGVSPRLKLAITLPALLQTAVRSFDRIEAKPNNHVAWYMIVPLSSRVDRSEGGQQPLIEAFCHQAIMNWTTTPTWRQLQYDQAFYEEVKVFNTTTASLMARDDWREVVQPSMRELMTKSKELEKMLLAEYERSKEWLGFTLIN